MPASSAALELVLRQDRKAIQKACTWPGGPRKREDDRVGIRCGGAERLAVGPQAGGERTVDLLVVHRTQGKQHVRRGEGRRVGPGQSLSEVKRDAAAVRARLPSVGQPGFHVERRAIHANQTRLREMAYRLGGVVGGHVWIEGVRIGANRGHDLTAADATVGGGRAVGDGTQEERQRGEQSHPS